MVEERDADRPRLVVGLGTGRSGTHSLADLLALQPGTTAFHQPPPCLPWHVDPGWYRDVGSLVAAQTTPVVGLVAWYYLPYAPLLLRDHDARFVCLRRDRDQTVTSIDRLTAQFDNWSSRSPSESVSGRYRHLFPQYDVADKREALGRYHDDYHDRVSALAAQHPDRVATFPTEHLNQADGVAEVLAFLGYGDDAVVETGIRSGLMADGYSWTGEGS